MKIRVQDGRVYQGTARQIVQQMQDIAMGAPSMTLTDYVDWVAARAGQFEGVPLEPKGATDDEKCASLLEQMLARGLAERM